MFFFILVSCVLFYSDVGNDLGLLVMIRICEWLKFGGVIRSLGLEVKGMLWFFWGVERFVVGFDKVFGDCVSVEGFDGICGCVERVLRVVEFWFDWCLLFWEYIRCWELLEFGGMFRVVLMSCGDIFWRFLFFW